MTTEIILASLLIVAIIACIKLYVSLKKTEEIAMMDLSIDCINIMTGDCKAYIIEQPHSLVPCVEKCSIDVWLEYEDGRVLCKRFEYTSDDKDGYLYAYHCAEELADMINAKY